MRSPFTGEDMKIVRENISLPYRKDEFEIVFHAYECEKTKERFTSDELDLININQVHNQYREKYGVPFPEEIREIREKYEVSAKKMSEILGLGSNAYRLYESGEMPSVAIGRLILSIKEAEEFKKQISLSSHLLKESEYLKLIKNIERQIDVEKDAWKKIYEDEYAYKTIDDHSGFKLLDVEKIANALSYFAATFNIELFKTKVNKLLFYCDFLNYQKTGRSMFGITYRAIPFGPVPVEYEKIYKQFLDEQTIEIKIPTNYECAEIFIPQIKFDASFFNETELQVLNNIGQKFSHSNTTDIVNISHNEPAWKDNKDSRSIISYKKYAFDLKAFEN